jgi:hypothetical protein
MGRLRCRVHCVRRVARLGSTHRAVPHCRSYLTRHIMDVGHLGGPMGCRSNVPQRLRRRAAWGVHACSFGIGTRYSSAGRDANVVSISSSFVAVIPQQLRQRRLHTDSCLRWGRNHRSASRSRAGSPLGYLDSRTNRNHSRCDRGGHSSAIGVGIPSRRSTPNTDSSCLPGARAACGVSKSILWHAWSRGSRSCACDIRGRCRSDRHNCMFMRYVRVLAIPRNQGGVDPKGRTRRWSRLAIVSCGMVSRLVASCSTLSFGNRKPRAEKPEPWRHFAKGLPSSRDSVPRYREVSG